MKMKRQNEGFTVALVLGALFIVLMVTMTLVFRLASHSSRVQKKLETEAARYWAEAALVHGMAVTEPSTKVDVADGYYEIVTREELKQGALGQKIIHVVTQAVTNQGAHAGCLYTFERYPNGTIVPFYFNRFERQVNLQDDVTVRQLIKGELITKREKRLRKKFQNLQAEIALSKQEYKKALLQLGKGQTFVDDWSKTVDLLVRRKME